MSLWLLCIYITDCLFFRVWVEAVNNGVNMWHSGEGGYELVSTEEWEEEQKRLDREWYSIDEGYDESHNPFSGLSDEYTKRKEQEIEQKRKKKISARQRQIQKVYY